MSSTTVSPPLFSMPRRVAGEAGLWWTHSNSFRAPAPRPSPCTPAPTPRSHGAERAPRSSQFLPILGSQEEGHRALFTPWRLKSCLTFHSSIRIFDTLIGKTSQLPRSPLLRFRGRNKHVILFCVMDTKPPLHIKKRREPPTQRRREEKAQHPTRDAIR